MNVRKHQKDKQSPTFKISIKTTETSTKMINKYKNLHNIFQKPFNLKSVHITKL